MNLEQLLSKYTQELNTEIKTTLQYLQPKLNLPAQLPTSLLAVHVCIDLTQERLARNTPRIYFKIDPKSQSIVERYDENEHPFCAIQRILSSTPPHYQAHDEEQLTAMGLQHVRHWFETRIAFVHFLQHVEPMDDSPKRWTFEQPMKYSIGKNIQIQFEHSASHIWPTTQATIRKFTPCEDGEIFKSEAHLMFRIDDTVYAISRPSARSRLGTWTGYHKLSNFQYLNISLTLDTQIMNYFHACFLTFSQHLNTTGINLVMEFLDFTQV